MSNALTIFDQQRPQLPAEFAGFLEENTNLTPRETVPSLGIEGKVWTVSLNNERTKLMRTNSQTGDEEPVSILPAIILGYAARRGRAYYEGAYDPSKPIMPACWSDDGDKPSERVKEPKASTCGKCPLAVKGSKVTDAGKQTTACSQHRMLALVVPMHPEEPLRLKLPITSDFDPDQGEKTGWYAWSAYRDMLISKQVEHTSQIVTKLKFDPNVAYPKVLFSPGAWTPLDRMNTLIPLIKSEKVKGLLDGSWSPNGVDGTKEDNTPKAGIEPDGPAPVDAGKKFIKEEAKPVTTASPIVEQVRAAQEEEDISWGEATPAEPAPKPTAQAAKPAKPAANQPKKAESKPKQSEPKPAAQPAPATAAASQEDLEALLNGWA